MSSTAYEPYSHRNVDEYSAEKPLVLSRGIEDNHHVKQHSRQKPKKSTTSQHVRTTLRTLVLILAATIVAVQVHAIVIWLNTRENMMQNTKGGWRMAQWAIIDASSTYAILGVAAGGFLAQVVALIGLCVWTSKIHDSKWRVALVYISSILFIAAWIGGLAYFKAVQSMGDKRDRWDMWSWSCYEKPSVEGKIPWKALCIEMQYTFYASIAVAVFEILSFVIFIVSQCKLRKQTKYGKVKAPW